VKGSSQKCQIGRTSSAVPFELHALFLPTTRETLDLLSVSPVRGQHRGEPRNDRRDFVHAKCHPLSGPLGIANGSAIRARVRVSLSRSSLSLSRSLVQIDAVQRKVGAEKWKTQIESPCTLRNCETATFAVGAKWFAVSRWSFLVLPAAKMFGDVIQMTGDFGKNTKWLATDTIRSKKSVSTLKIMYCPSFRLRTECSTIPKRRKIESRKDLASLSPSHGDHKRNLRNGTPCQLSRG